MKIQHLILFAFLAGCTVVHKQPAQDEQESLPHIINMSEMKFSDTPQCLSEFADSIGYIRLSEEPLIPDIAYLVDIYVDNNENIYISKDHIYKFSPNGKFIKSLFKIGQGPEEITLKLGRPVFSLNEASVLVNNYGSESFRKYSLDGEYQENITKWNDKVEECIVGHIDDKVIFRQGSQHYNRGDMINMDGPYLWYVKDRSNDSIVFKMQNGLFHVKVEKGFYTLIEGDYPLYFDSIDSIYYIRHTHQDTIFKTTDALKWQPWYVIKHHKRDADYKLIMKSMAGDALLEDVRGSYQVYEVYPLPTGVLFIYKGMNDLFTDGQIGFCKHGEKALTSSNSSFKNDLDDCLKTIKIPLFPHYQRNGYLYVLVNAIDFMEDGSKAPFPELTEESNPVVVKLKLKR